MKKIMLAFAICFCSIALIAGPHHGRGPGGRGGWGPPRCGGYYGGCYGNSGVALAAGITGIVANSLGIVNNVVGAANYYTQPVYTTSVYTAPVYTTPVYTAPVYQQPVYYSQPVYTPQPVIYQPAPRVYQRRSTEVYYRY